MDVDLTPMLFVLTVSLAAVQSRIDTGPMNALMKVGDTVTLECVTDNKNCEGVEWSKQEGEQSPNLVYRDGRGLLNNNRFPPGRYSVNPTGGCSLTIKQLEIGDSGKFTCMHRDADSVEFTRISVLVVIDVTESCLSNVTNNTLAETDGYSFWTAINVPAKSVEPSTVSLSFQNKAAGETEIPESTQVKTTLIGTATKLKIENRLCRASFTPKPQDNLDSTTATLDICTPQPLIASYPVESIALLPSGPYYKGAEVLCNAEGYPLPTITWTNNNGKVVNGSTLVIKEDAGTNYTCTATNMVKGTAATKSIMIQVSLPSESSCGGSCVVGIVVAVIIIIVVVIFALGWFFVWCPLFPIFHKTDSNKDPKRNGEKSSVPLTGPVKPPRVGDAPADV